MAGGEEFFVVDKKKRTRKRRRLDWRFRWFFADLDSIFEVFFSTITGRQREREMWRTRKGHGRKRVGGRVNVYEFRKERERRYVMMSWRLDVRSRRAHVHVRPCRYKDDRF